MLQSGERLARCWKVNLARGQRFSAARRRRPADLCRGPPDCSDPFPPSSLSLTLPSDELKPNGSTRAQLLDELSRPAVRPASPPVVGPSSTSALAVRHVGALSAIVDLAREQQRLRRVVPALPPLLVHVRIARIEPLVVALTRSQAVVLALPASLLPRCRPAYFSRPEQALTHPGRRLCEQHYPQRGVRPPRPRRAPRTSSPPSPRRGRRLLWSHGERVTEQQQQLERRQR